MHLTLKDQTKPELKQRSGFSTMSPPPPGSFVVLWLHPPVHLNILIATEAHFSMEMREAFDWMCRPRRPVQVADDNNEYNHTQLPSSSARTVKPP